MFPFNWNWNGNLFVMDLLRIKTVKGHFRSFFTLIPFFFFQKNHALNQVRAQKYSVANYLFAILDMTDKRCWNIRRVIEMRGGAVSETRQQWTGWGVEYNKISLVRKMCHFRSTLIEDIRYNCARMLGVVIKCNSSMGWSNAYDKTSSLNGLFCVEQTKSGIKWSTRPTNNGS